MNPKFEPYKRKTVTSGYGQADVLVGLSENEPDRIVYVVRRVVDMQGNVRECLRVVTSVIDDEGLLDEAVKVVIMDEVKKPVFA